MTEEKSEELHMFSSMESRCLTEEEMEKMAKQTDASEFKKKQYETNARKNWDVFYHRNGENFFKDRNWSAEDMKGICEDVDFDEEVSYLEAGCGVGNMIFPLKTEIPNLRLFAFDFSQNAVRMLEERAIRENVKVCTSVVDLSIPSEENPFSEKVDLATLIYVLSAIHPEKFTIVAENMKKYLKPGGSVVVRDYGENDHAMIRFGRESRLGDRFYVRQDGTRAYYFSLDELVEIFESVGFKCVKKEYLHRMTINRQKNLKVARIFVQARFVLPF